MKHYQGGDVEYGYGVTQAPDGDFIVAGYVGSGPGGGDACIMKLDPVGTQQWTIAYGGPNGEDARGVVTTRDGGIAFVGQTSSFGSGSADILVVKTDILGSIIWAKAIGGPGYDVGHAIDTTSDGGVVVCGSTESFGAGASDMYVLKFDAAGNLQWNRTIGGPAPDQAFSVVQTFDGGYAVGGQTSSFGAGGVDYYLAKLDPAGALTFAAAFGGPGHDFGYRLAATSDDGILFGGYSAGFGVGGMDGMIIKLSPLGGVAWARTYGTPVLDRVFNVFEASDGNYIATGEGTTSTFGAGDQQIFKITSAGTLIWARHYGTGVDETGYGASIRTADRGLILAAWDDNSEDILVTKTDSLGNSKCNNALIALTTLVPPISASLGGIAGLGAIVTNLTPNEDPFPLLEIPYCSTMLPISSISLKGDQLGGDIVLNWRLAAPDQARSVMLERSEDGSMFKTIYQIAGANASGAFQDPASGRDRWYRLTIVGLDGAWHQSEILYFPSTEQFYRLELHTALNPVSAHHISQFSNDHAVMWELLSMDGRSIRSGCMPASVSPAKLVLADIPSGIYLLQLAQGKQRKIIRMAF